MRIRSFITLVAMLGAPLFAGDEVGYYAIGYSNTGTSPVVTDSSAATAAGCPSTVASSAPKAAESTPMETSTPVEASTPIETGSTTSASNNGGKVWAAKAAIAIPFNTGNASLYENFSFNLGIKRFLPTDIPNLTVPLEAELTFIWLGGEFDSYHGDYFEGFNFDLYIHALARYSPVSFFYVEAGLEIGSIIFSTIHGEGDDYDDGVIRFGIPLGFGFKLLDTFEIGQRLIMGIPNYAKDVGSLFRYEIVSVSYLF